MFSVLLLIVNPKPAIKTAIRIYKPADCNKPSNTNCLITEDNVAELNEKLKSTIAEKYDKELKTIEVSRGSELEKNIKESIIDYINQNNIVFQSNSLKLKVIEDFMIGLSSYGILQPLMDDDEIEEIYVYAPDKIWHLKEGKNVLSSIRFESPEKLKSYTDNALGRIGRNINNANSTSATRKRQRVWNTGIY